MARYRVKVRKEVWREAWEWCGQQFGSRLSGNEYYTLGIFSEKYKWFSFECPNNASVFKLTWGKK